MNAPDFRPSDAVARVEAASLRPKRKAGPEIASLALGEPDFDTPAPITEAAIAALRAGYTHYSDFSGDPELRDLLAQQLSAAAGLAYAREQIVVTHGGTAGLAATILAIVNGGDRVVIPEPTYSLYADVVQLAGAQVVHVPKLPDFHLDLERLEAALKGARLLVLCSPDNPTGAVFRRDELAAVAQMLADSDTLVIADEAYNTIVYGDRPFVSALSIGALLPRLIYTQTFSKTYAMTGWRVGYVAAPAPVAKAIATAHRTFNGSPNAVVHRAALEACRLGPKLAEPMLAQYALRRDYTIARVNAIAGLHAAPPEGSFYVFVRYDHDVPASELTDRLLDAGVAVRAGTEYGPSGEHHFRLSFATSRENLDEALTRLERALQNIARRPGASVAP